MEKAEKLSWIEQFKIACFKPREYSRLLSVAKGRVIWFFVLISFLITFLGFAMDLFAFSASVGGTKNFILNRLPAFELRDGKLDIEDSMDFTIAGCHVTANTEKAKVDTDVLSNQYTIEVMFAKDEMVIKNSALQQAVVRISFDQYQDIVFNNQAMLKFIPFIYMMSIVAFISKWIANTIEYLIFCAVISWLVYLNQKVRQDAVAFGKIFQLSIYARVIFQLIETIGITVGMEFFSGMAWMLISYFGSYQLLLMSFIKPEPPKMEL